MPISNLDPAALAGMTTQQLADLVLAADQEARHQKAIGNRWGYLRWKLESRRLCAVMNRD